MAENKARSNTNVIALTGTLVRDSELKTVGNGFNVLNFSIANNYVQKSGDKYVQNVNYFDVKVLGRRADGFSKVLKKGTGVSISGVLRQERWQGQDGKTASRIVINCDEIEITRWVGGQQNETAQANAPVNFDSQPADNSGFPEQIPF